MENYHDKLSHDLVEQFKEKPHIDGLLHAIGKQLDDLSLFFFQLKTKRSLDEAEGTQLDKIGEIVDLSRAKASALTGLTNTMIDDDVYRHHLYYKILKNTSNCTYEDIRKTLSMFWSGPQFSYTESPDNPACIKLDFEASNQLGENSFIMPFIKAGGVGVNVHMHKQDDTNALFGIGFRSLSSISFGCESIEVWARIVLTDEQDNVLCDENDNEITG